MVANEKLQHVQTELDKLGVRDVKFFFSPEAKSAMYSALQNDVVDVLTKYLSGNKVSVTDFSEEVVPAIAN
jgi:hypothetical protein